jgi:hypothetical protein
MTRKYCVLKFLVAAILVSVAATISSPILHAQILNANAQAVNAQAEADGPFRQRLADLYPLIDDTTDRTSVKNSINNMPIPAGISTMTADTIPPFAAHPQLEPASRPSELSADDISFEENIPVASQTDEVVDDFCDELTEMIARNLNQEVSLETKKKMIEMALKMVARSVTLKSESKISNLKSEHQLEKARYQSQLMAMRIRFQGLADNQHRLARAAATYEQQAKQKHRQEVAQMAYENEAANENKTAYESVAANAHRQTIRLTSPPQNDAVQNRIDQLSQEIAALQQRLEAVTPRSTVRTASYVEAAQTPTRATPLRPSQPNPQPLRRMHQTYPQQWTR